MGNQIHPIRRCQPFIVLDSGDVGGVHFVTAGLSGSCSVVPDVLVVVVLVALLVRDMVRLVFIVFVAHTGMVPPDRACGKTMAGTCIGWLG